MMHVYGRESCEACNDWQSKGLGKVPTVLSSPLQSAEQSGSASMVSAEDNVFAQLGLLGRSHKAVPQALTRRILELLTYLAKHQSRMAREMLTLKVPTPEEQLQLIERNLVWRILLCWVFDRHQIWHKCRSHDMADTTNAYVCHVWTPQLRICLS